MLHRIEQFSLPEVAEACEVSLATEAAIEAARAREAPWNVQRSVRIEREIVAKRLRSATARQLARWAIGGLASAALYASVIHVAQLMRAPGMPEGRLDEMTPVPSEAIADEPGVAERPVGDGGFD